MKYGLGIAKSVTRGISLSLGTVVLLSSSSALAGESSLNLSRLLPTAVKMIERSSSEQYLSQATAPDVVIPDGGSGSTTTTTTTTSTTSTNADTRFQCQLVNGEYTVMYSPVSEEGRAYPWAIPRRLGGGWTAERRCTEISRRLESYRPDGLTELQTGVENGYNTICATTQADSRCRIVLTVPPGQDPIVTRDLVFENLLVAEEGRATQGVNTFASQGSSLFEQVDQLLNTNLSSRKGRRSHSRRSDGIDLRPFLTPADGGTGSQL